MGAGTCAGLGMLLQFIVAEGVVPPQFAFHGVRSCARAEIPPVCVGKCMSGAFTDRLSAGCVFSIEMEGNK